MHSDNMHSDNMHSDNIEYAARDNLAQVLGPDVAPGDLDLDRGLSDEYGLTSLDMVVFITSVCDDTDVPLSQFTEHDLANMRTLRDVTRALARHAGTGVAS